MTKGLLVGDVHLRDKPPSLRKEGFSEQILDKLRWIIDYSNKNGMSYVMLLGDVFDVKTPNKTSHKLVQSTASVLEESNVPVYITLGNHDLTNNQVSSVVSQPIGSLGLSPSINILAGQSVSQEGASVFSVPYFNENKDEFDSWMENYNGEELLTTHSAIFPDGEIPPYNHIPASEFVSWIPDTVKHVAFGHIHTPFGSWEASGVTFCNNGAISRGSLHYETLNRDLRVTVYDPDSEEVFEPIGIPYLPADEVFNLDIKEAELENKKVSQDFRETLAQAKLNMFSTEFVVAKAQEVLNDDANKMFVEILEEVQ